MAKKRLILFSLELQNLLIQNTNFFFNLIQFNKSLNFNEQRPHIYNHKFFRVSYILAFGLLHFIYYFFF